MSDRDVTLAVYPGSFDPPTVAHLAIARAALDHVDEVRFVLSRVALGKEDVTGRASVHDRFGVLEAMVADVDGWTAAMTSERLVVDIVYEARADAVIIGTDKWSQLIDPRWYDGDPVARDAAVAALPTILFAPRSEASFPAASAWPGLDLVLLDIDPGHADVSSTRARAGEPDLMAEAARRSDLWQSS